MKIAVASIGKELISYTYLRFGRAEYFIIVDSETLEYDVVENKQNLDSPHGAGIQAAKTVVDQKADVLISGRVGPKAFQVLNAAGVKVITGVEGRVVDVIAQYKSGRLETAEGPDVKGHWV